MIRGARVRRRTSREPSLRSAIRRVASIGMLFVVLMVLGAFTSPMASASCPNETFRSGSSAQLPDCRAYELVTPRKVNGTPGASMPEGNIEDAFNGPSALEGGNSYLWTLGSAGLPDTESNGYSNLYEAIRTDSGWRSLRVSPSSSQAEGPNAGGYSGDQKYMLFQLDSFRGGSLVVPESLFTTYVRYPDGSFHLFGEGTVPAAPDADGYPNGFTDDFAPLARWISPGGTHQIFESSVQLTAEAPAGWNEVYDRTPSGLHLVSLLPGDAPAAGAPSEFAGISVDGSTTLFTYLNGLYARVDDEATHEVASAADGPITPAGVSQDGSTIFFVQAGTIFMYRVATEVALPIVSSGNPMVANVSADGSHLYFVSEAELVAGKGTSGAPNLYVWADGSTHFIATLNAEDVAHGSDPVRGLGAWAPLYDTRAPSTNANAVAETSRTTADGSVFVFESREKLTDYPTEGHIAIYRYTANNEQIVCVSCSPVNPAAGNDSELLVSEADRPVRVYRMLQVANLSADGQQVVFESKDSLLPQDIDGVRDVYEWRNGTLSLISSGNSPQPSGLFGVSPSGNDIFFETAERLVPGGQETGAFAIYDARVAGGLAAQQIQQPLDCVGEACQGEPTPPPAAPAMGSSAYNGAGNVKPRCRAHLHRKTHRKRRAHGKKRQSGKKKSCKARRRGSSK